MIGYGGAWTVAEPPRIAEALVDSSPVDRVSFPIPRQLRRATPLSIETSLSRPRETASGISSSTVRNGSNTDLFPVGQEAMLAVSVICPFYNEEAILEEAIGALMERLEHLDR